MPHNTLTLTDILSMSRLPLYGMGRSMSKGPQSHRCCVYKEVLRCGSVCEHKMPYINNTILHTLECTYHVATLRLTSECRPYV